MTVLMSNYSHSDPVNNTIRKYENHPSVEKITETVTITSTFHFPGVDKADVGKSNGNLNSSKVGTFKNIPTKCLKVTSDIMGLCMDICIPWTYVVRFLRLPGI